MDLSPVAHRMLHLRPMRLTASHFVGALGCMLLAAAAPCARAAVGLPPEISISGR